MMNNKGLELNHWVNRGRLGTIEPALTRLRSKMVSDKDIYYEFCHLVHVKDILVVDQDSIGYASPHKWKGVIYINYTLGFRDKLFVLLHEIGHLFKVRDGHLIRRKKASKESIAHSFAIKVLKKLGYEEKSYNNFLEYARCYEHAARKSWNPDENQ